MPGMRLQQTGISNVASLGPTALDLCCSARMGERWRHPRQRSRCRCSARQEAYTRITAVVLGMQDMALVCRRYRWKPRPLFIARRTREYVRADGSAVVQRVELDECRLHCRRPPRRNRSRRMAGLETSLLKPKRLRQETHERLPTKDLHAANRESRGHSHQHCSPQPADSRLFCC